MSSPKPPSEKTSDQNSVTVDWNAIAAHPDFTALVRRKMRLIIPATVFFVVYYFLLPIGVGWFPEFMQKPVWADMNLAYLFALSQFFMSWALALVYVVAAAGWDRRETALLAKFGFTSKH